MNRIAITGASGFLGSHVAEFFAAKGFAVTANGRQLQRLQQLNLPNGNRVQADLCEDDLQPVVADAHSVIHCAALTSPWGPASAFHDANVVATQKLLRACKQNGVRRFIHVSSPSIYFKFSDQLALTEAFTPPARWINAYAHSKWLAEQIVLAEHSADFHVVILRPRAIFGERDQAIMPRILNIAKSGRFPLINHGRAMIDVSYVENVAHAIYCALQSDHRSGGRAFNISNDSPLSVNDLVTQLFAALQLNVKLINLPRSLALAIAQLSELRAKLQPGCPEPRLTRYGVGVMGYSQTLDVSAARNLLGYEAPVTISEGITRYAHWWSTHDQM